MNFKNYCNKLSLVLVLSFALVALNACQEQEPAKPKQEASKLVKTMVLGNAEAGHKVAYPGTVEATQKADLAFRVPGQIIEFPVKEGDLVKKSQVLARLDPEDYQNNYNVEKARLEQSHAQYLRYKQLLSTGTVSHADYEVKKADYEVAKAQTALAKKALDDTYLRATFPGFVAQTFVENFENVRAKQEILSLQDITHIDIVIQVPEKDILKSQQDLETRLAKHENIKAAVIFDSLPKRTFQASVKKFATEADKKTQTYKVTLIMKTPKDANILPGMSATVKADFDVTEQNTFFVPVHAVVGSESNKKYVWLVDMQTMMVKKQFVKVGQLQGEEILVTEGLKTGDRIVVAGAHLLRDNMKVRIYKQLI